MRPTLVVVDMQNEFAASCKLEVVTGVAAEITKAQQQHLPIVLVEYEGCGPTHKCLLQLLKGYPYKARVHKKDDDGSTEIIRTLRRRGFNEECLRVCGVNVDACVWATVEGLLCKLKYSRVEVVKAACATEYKFDWRQYFKHHRMTLV